MSTHKVIETFPDIPRAYTRRVGDIVIEGSNNSIIVLGTDRTADGPADVDTGLGTVEAQGGGKKTGSALVSVGRKDPDGNPDLDKDDAFLLLSMRTEVDKNLETTFESDDTGPSAVLKTDHVRVVFRKNMKISATEKETWAFIDNDHLHVNLQDKAKIDVDVNGLSSEARIDIQGNIIDIKSGGEITIIAKDTQIDMRQGGQIQVGNLAAALTELISILTSTGLTISETGNLGAPVPMNPKLVSELNGWVSNWMSNNVFVNMSDGEG